MGAVEVDDAVALLVEGLDCGGGVHSLTGIHIRRYSRKRAHLFHMACFCAIFVLEFNIIERIVYFLNLVDLTSLWIIDFRHHQFQIIDVYYGLEREVPLTKLSVETIEDHLQDIPSTLISILRIIAQLTEQVSQEYLEYLLTLEIGHFFRNI